MEALSFVILQHFQGCSCSWYLLFNCNAKCDFQHSSDSEDFLDSSDSESTHDASCKDKQEVLDSQTRATYYNLQVTSNVHRLNVRSSMGIMSQKLFEELQSIAYLSA